MRHFLRNYKPTEFQMVCPACGIVAHNSLITEASWHVDTREVVPYSPDISPAANLSGFVEGTTFACQSCGACLLFGTWLAVGRGAGMIADQDANAIFE